jgi:hypothetical protein
MAAALFSRDAGDSAIIGIQRLAFVQSSFVRERLSVTGNEATETLDQSATSEATAFGIVQRRWRLRRRGEYSWAKLDGVEN